MNDVLKRFHTKVGAALADASTWPSLAAVIGGAVSVPHPYSYGVMICGVVGVFLKGGNNAANNSQPDKQP